MIGGSVYIFLEMAFRGHSHWTMFCVGGLCFVLCGLVNEYLEWDMIIWLQMMICAVCITLVEFLSGCYLNLWLGMDIWDYSSLPMNVAGQICLPFTVLWFFLSAIAIILDDYVRYWFFGEEKPRYIWR